VRARSEQGFTLVEVLIAMTLMAVGIAATLGVFGSSGRTTLAAQRTDVASQKAQAALDLISTLPYDQIGLTSTPASSTNPLDPGSRVSGTDFRVKTGLTERFVLSTDTGQSGAAVDPTPQSFSVGSGNSAISGKVYRYVTWRDEICPTGVCDGTQNTKRVTVAVTLDPNGTLPARPPVWVSQVIHDPDALKPGITPPPPSGSGSTVSAQNFYLYDTRCGFDTRQAQTASHATHNTASSGSGNYSTCVNSDVTKQPDLMGPNVPTGDATTPLHIYSTDLTGTYIGGLAMKRQGTTCPTSYPAADTTNVNATNEWSIHAWTTKKFTSTFTLDGQVSLSLFTSTLGGASGQGVVCATLLDRLTSGTGVPTDTTLGSTTHTLSTWPTTVRRIHFTFSLSGSANVAVDHRLVLVLGVKGSSDNDLYFLYDHPSYSSFLQVATPTPL
jgi:prepilin-type N-terminal cleavage/methylation domain-containing protein